MNPRDPRILAVNCLGCGSPLSREREIAVVQRINLADTLYVRYTCPTPDCGTEVVIEEDV
jgi:endogenous inhibitor of DNA gyrase (YacG/DUF329 family)